MKESNPCGESPALPPCLLDNTVDGPFKDGAFRDGVIRKLMKLKLLGSFNCQGIARGIISFKIYIQFFEDIFLFVILIQQERDREREKVKRRGKIKRHCRNFDKLS